MTHRTPPHLLMETGPFDDTDYQAGNPGNYVNIQGRTVFIPKGGEAQAGGRTFSKKGAAPKRQPKWRKPDLGDEMGEIERTAEELGVDPRKLKHAAKKGGVSKLSDKDWEGMENTDSWETDTPEKARDLAKEYERDISRVEAGLDKGGNMPAPVVLFRKDKPPYLIGGNTRLMAARAKGIRPKIWKVQLEHRTPPDLMLTEAKISKKFWDVFAKADDTAVWVATGDLEDDLEAGKISPQEVLRWVEAGVRAGEEHAAAGRLKSPWTDDFDFGSLKRAAIMAKDLSPVLKKARGKKTVHVRLKSSRANVNNYVVHRSSRPNKSTHPIQISEFDRKMEPWGHRERKGTMEDALREVWKDDGPFELVKAESMNRARPVLLEHYSQGVVKVHHDKLRAIDLRVKNVWRIFERNPELALERLGKLKGTLEVLHDEFVEGDTCCDGGIHLRHEDLERKLYVPTEKAIKWLTASLEDETGKRGIGGARQQLKIMRKYLRGDFVRDELPTR